MLERFNEQGNVMVMALLVFMALSVVGTAVLGVSSMEMKMSNYAYKAEQAGQAADAGIDWTAEKIYMELQNYLLNEELPDNLYIANPDIELGIVNISDISKVKQTSNPEGINCCTYNCTCKGIYEGASKTVKIIISYDFIGGYINGEVFVPRNYLNRGKIISYKTDMHNL